MAEVKGKKQNKTTITGSVPKENLENFNTRLISDLHTEMKVYCAINRVKIQDFVNEAIKEKLEANK